MIDGDRWRRLPGAVVHLWGRTGRTDRHGVAEIRVPWRRPLPVTVSVRGYGERTVYEDFAAYRKLTVRVYRPDLQWPLYGAVGTRTQSQVHIRLRPPFRTVWAVPMGGLIEFPAVVSDGVAYIGNATATVRAISMVKGTVLWTHQTPHGKMASSPAVIGGRLVYHSMDGNVFVLDRANGRLLWHYHVGSPVESSPIVEDGIDYFGAWNGRLYALDLRDAPPALEQEPRREDHLERRHLREHAVHRRLRGPALGAVAAHRRDALDGGRERPDLRDAGGRGRPRVRAVVERRLADGVHDRRTRALAVLARRLRLLVAGGLGRPRLHRLVQRRLLRALGGERPRALGGRRPAEPSPARRSSWTASRTPGASPTGSSASTRAAAAC